MHNTRRTYQTAGCAWSELDQTTLMPRQANQWWFQRVGGEGRGDLPDMYLCLIYQCDGSGTQDCLFRRIVRHYFLPGLTDATVASDVDYRHGSRGQTTVGGTRTRT